MPQPSPSVKRTLDRLLQQAINDRDKDLMQATIEKGADVEIFVKDAYLRESVLVGATPEFLQMVAARTKDKQFLLVAGICRKDIAMAEDALKQGADIAKGNPRGTALIQHLYQSFDKKVFEWFLKKGLNIDAPAKNGETILMQAVRGGASNASMIEFLLINGADATIADKNGVTAFETLHTTNWYDEKTKKKILKQMLQSLPDDGLPTAFNKKAITGKDVHGLQPIPFKKNQQKNPPASGEPPAF